MRELIKRLMTKPAFASFVAGLCGLTVVTLWED